MDENERDRILLLERIDNLIYERDNLMDALRELVKAQRQHGPVDVEVRIKHLLGENWDA